MREPDDWRGEPAFIIAGGPSAEKLDLSLLKGRHVIAINSSWRTYPEASVLFYADDRWWRELGKPALGGDGEKWCGQIVTTSSYRPPRALHRKRRNPAAGISLDRDAVALERSSTCGAINEAVHRGANPIILLGLDGKEGEGGKRHNHGEKYPWKVMKNSFKDQVKEYEQIAPSLVAKGVRVINANPDSVVDTWPKMKFEETLDMPAESIVQIPSLYSGEPGDTVRVFVGCSANGEDAESMAVLEYTLRKHSSLPIEITWMMHSRDPQSFWHGFNSSEWKTPFSGFRWAIPAACGYAGRAIYTDSDVIFMADVAELWRQDMKGHAILAKTGGRICVSLWDCAAAKKYVLPIDVLRSNPQSHKIMQNMTRSNPSGLMAHFKGDWNCLDGEGYTDLRNPQIKAIHYTEMASQPHLDRAIARLEAVGQKHWMDGQRNEHPRKDLVALFDQLFEEAEEAGYVTGNYVPNQLYGAYVKSSLKDYRGGHLHRASARR